MNVTPESALVPSSTARGHLDALSDEEIDALPFGVIALARDGTIQRYNLAESRFARLDRNQVIGKNFFRRVAPCTATPEFEGRIATMLEDPMATDPVRFDYVFDFRFGAQEVQVELRRAANERVYVCITRKRLLTPRVKGVARAPAVQQSELAPNEGKLGVERDVAQQRVVQVSPMFFEGLVAAADRAPLPTGFFEEWGFAWGRLAVVELEADALERFELLLRDLPMVTVAEFISEYLRRRGWGRATFDFALAARGAFVVELERSVLAEAGMRAPARRCALLAGFFRAVFGHLAHRRLAFRETRCVAAGAPACEIVAVGEERAAALDAAIAVGEQSAARALDRMAAERRRGR